MPSGRLESRIEAHASRVTCLLRVFGAVWSASFDGTIHVFDAATRQTITVLKEENDKILYIIKVCVNHHF